MTASAFSEITQLLEAYFDGLYHSDVEILATIFHPKAIYATADDAPLLHRTMEQYLPVVAARQSPASRGEPRRDHIDEIQMAGENTALARVRCSIGHRAFVDFLSLVRTNGEWRIMAKIFQIAERDA